MTQSFSTTEDTNDIFIGTDDRLAIATGIEAVKFAAANAAKAQLGEMIYAVNRGVANFQTIWTNSVNIAQFEASVRAAILGTPGVSGIQSFDMQVFENSMHYQAIIITIYGTGAING